MSETVVLSSGSESSATWVAQLLELTTGAATSWAGWATAYFVAISEAATHYNNLAEQLPAGWPPWLKVVAIFGLPVLVFLFQVIPMALENRRKKRVIEGDIRAGYFQLTPRQTVQDFPPRPDGKHDEILAWLKGSEEAVLYLTGQSGCGKSSVLEGWVIPKLKEEASAPLVLLLRGYQDPVDMLVQGCENLTLCGSDRRPKRSRRPIYSSVLVRSSNRGGC